MEIKDGAFLGLLGQRCGGSLASSPLVGTIRNSLGGNHGFLIVTIFSRNHESNSTTTRPLRSRASPNLDRPRYGNRVPAIRNTSLTWVDTDDTWSGKARSTGGTSTATEHFLSVRPYGRQAHRGVLMCVTDYITGADVTGHRRTIS